MTRKNSAAEIAEWTQEMRADVPPGSTLTTVLRHRSASGMTRDIDVYSFTCEDGRVVKRWLSYRAAAILGWTFNERTEAVRVSGAGMDMGFHLVYSLSRRLYPDGFTCTGKDYPDKRCPSNDHSNGAPIDGTMHHSDGGYAISHEWLG